MKRKVPAFTVYHPKSIPNVPEIEDVVIEELLSAVKYAIKMKKKSVPICEVAGSGFYIKLNKEQYRPSLEKAMKYFVTREQFEKCAEIRDLIEKVSYE